VAKLPRSQAFIYIFLLLFSLILSFLPAWLGWDFADWYAQAFGKYHFLVLSILIFATLSIIAYLFTNRISLTTNLPTAKNFNINRSRRNIEICTKAKTAIEAAHPEEALRALSLIEDHTLEKEIFQITGQLTKYRQDTRLDLLDAEQKRIQLNQITKAILDLVEGIESNFKTEEKHNQLILESLKKRYTDRLDQKLAKRQPINLRISSSEDGTSKETSSGFVTISSGKVQSEIGQIFDEAHCRLLIVGAPGAGKTCLLLQLALKLLEQEKYAIPVLLNLATWQESHITLENWLSEVLPSEIGTDHITIRQMLAESRLILLLDGFDEVNEDYRTSCLEAIGRYGEVSGRRFAITSRLAEYRSVFKDAPVAAQVEIGPLTYEQIRAELEEIGHNEPEAMPLLTAIQENTYLREVVQTPFYFNVLQLLFAQGVRVSDFNFTTDSDKEKVQQKIIDKFVDFQLKPTQQQDSQRWLAFIASRMTQRNMVVFELADLQYDWWKWSRWEFTLGKLLAGLVNGLFHGIYYGILFASMGILFGLGVDDFIKLDSTVLKSLCIGFIGGILTGLILGLGNGIENSLKKNISVFIYLVETFPFSWSAFLQELKKDWKLNLAVLFSLVLASVSQFSHNLDHGIDSRSNGQGLTIALFVIVLFIFFLNTINVLSTKITAKAQSSSRLRTYYQRFSISASFFYFSILQNKFLRYQLYKKGKLPKDLIAFLREMSNQHLLESDGVSWRFRHGLIQEFFTKSWTEEGEKVKDALYYENLGSLAIKKEDYDQAIEWYKKAIEITPLDINAYNEIGTIYHNHKKDYDAAIEWYEKAIKINPKNPIYLGNMGNSLSVKKDYHEAIKWLKKAIEIKPKFVWAYNRLGDALANIQEYEQAIEYNKKAIEIDPQYIHAYNSVGIALKNQEKFEQAIDWYKKAIEINPKYIHAYNNMGVVLRNQGKFEQAIECHKKAIQIDSKSVYAYNDIGITLKNQEKYGEAIEWYKKAIDVDPQYVRAYNNIGAVLHNQEKYGEAIEWYKKAIDVDPQYVRAYNNIGAVLNDQEKYGEAIEWYKKAINVDPYYVYPYGNIGDVLVYQEEFDEAIEWYRKAINVNPEKPLYHPELATIHLFKREYDLSVEHSKEAITADPENQVNYAVLAASYLFKRKLADFYQELEKDTVTGVTAPLKAFLLSIYFLNQGDQQSAKIQLENTIAGCKEELEKTPDDTDWKELSGLALLLLDRPQAGKAILYESIDAKDPEKDFFLLGIISLFDPEDRENHDRLVAAWNICKHKNTLLRILGLIHQSILLIRYPTKSDEEIDHEVKEFRKKISGESRA
jgi:tetratricopeptide (TPR) repeat protein/GTPase SAR1 family protein